MTPQRTARKTQLDRWAKEKAWVCRATCTSAMLSARIASGKARFIGC